MFSSETNSASTPLSRNTAATSLQERRSPTPTMLSRDRGEISSMILIEHQERIYDALENATHLCSEKEASQPLDITLDFRFKLLEQVLITNGSSCRSKVI